ncbi:MAG TPA: MOSC domain-containing protein [Syntrophorhabdaceae bacterium]|nr:MOSC domain-containing protein [Syntrophorhabdaceae bacterium]HRR71534.1 MOSC domain-containing protein [Syntrophorhabdaceae bacterium]HRV22610.1 MOSC domain-containing protein [Syntrophorhabdaceae bacterium]
MKGKVLSVNISKDKGEKKNNIGRCRLIEEKGLEGDAHAGFMHRQVSLLALESIEKMRKKGINIEYGDFAENLTVEGMDLLSLPVGTKLRVGDGVILRVTQIGKQCHKGCAIFQQVGDCVMPKEGIFAEVITGGDVKIGDNIEVIE